MKKITLLLLLVGLTLGATTSANAIDFKAKGQWIMSFDYGEGMSGYSESRGGNKVYGSGFANSNSDMFEARQRLRLQLDAIASESLSATVYFEIGESVWGKADDGGALGADGSIIELKNAYIDWLVPQTDLKVRMGIQGINLPAYPSGGSQIFSDDVAGIVLTNAFSDMFSVTAFWARPYNDNFDGRERTAFESEISAGFLDNMDMFGLLFPMSFDGITMTPWIMYTAVGQNFARSWVENSDVMGNSFDYVYTGLFPVGMAGSMVGNSYPKNDLLSYGSIMHLGFTGDITLWDPLRLAWDLNYGNAQYGIKPLQRSGFYASLLAEYKMPWGIPGIYGWYSSGDDGDPKNGSEQMPTIDTNNGDTDFSPFASNGTPYIARSNIIGSTLVGTWGIGLRVRDFSFLENLKHTVLINYMEGTNSTEMAQYMRGIKTPNGWEPGRFSPSNNPDAAFDTAAGMYLTTADSAMEFGFTSDYQVYENFTISVEAAYLALWLDQDNDVWGSGFSATDAWNINASFVYSF